MEGVAYHIDSFHGVADFDSPSLAVQAAARLFVKLGLEEQLDEGPAAEAPILVWEPDQGHFPVWLAKELTVNRANRANENRKWLLTGRNILALRASRHNLSAVIDKATIALLCVLRPQCEEPSLTVLLRGPASWEGLETSRIVLAALPSVEAGRFDKAKPQGFKRLGDLRRGGFRAMAYTVH
jgi:hypothetical protein